MARKLILCLDGTNNKFKEANTNVVKLYAMLDRQDPQQLNYYQPGIGTMLPPGFWSKTKKWLVTRLDLAIAWLLEEHVSTAYRFLMRNYEKDDEIFIFGFSRGAYTARVLAGMLEKVGLLSRGNEELIPFAWDIYKTRETLKNGESQRFRATFARRVEVKFLGLWDSVSSVGWALIFGSASFQYTKVNSCVRNIRHAVSLDERRTYFVQNLWDPKIEPDQTLEEIWFPGVHSDVGGGYAEDEAGLSKIALQWMYGRAKQAGLRFNDMAVAANLPGEDKPQSAAAKPAAKKHESLHGAWWIVEYLPRRVKDPSKNFAAHWVWPRGRHRRVPENAKIHESVFQRKGQVTDYNPPNLPQSFQRVD